jgi:hypothetical protein
MKHLKTVRSRFVFMAAAVIALTLGARIVVKACTDGATSTELSFTKAWRPCDQDLVNAFWQGGFDRRFLEPGRNFRRL